MASRPAAFTKNMGQWPDSILFRTDIGEAVMWVVRDGIYYQYFRSIPGVASLVEASPLRGKFGGQRDGVETAIIKAEFVGANPEVDVIGLEELDYKYNYFHGNDPTKWRTDVPNYSGITLKRLFPGLDVSFRSADGHVFCEVSGTGQVGPDQLKVTYRGAQMEESTNGPVVLRTRLGDKTFQGCLPWIEDRGGPFYFGTPATATSSEASDATLVYSTRLVGSGYDHGKSVAVDGDGNAYVTGSSYSVDFPAQNPLQVFQGAADAFVAKLSPAGIVEYCTFLGGTSDDFANGIAIDGSGNAFIVGQTTSTDFPTQNPYQPEKGGIDDAFVSKLSPDGSSLVYSTYLGGSSGEAAYGNAVDSSGHAYLTGMTGSTDFPVQNPYQTHQGGDDVYVTKFSPGGDSVVFSTFLGGSGSDVAYGIAVEDSGSVYITGTTASTDFPTHNPYLTDRGGIDAFVSRLSPDGSGLVYSTYLGGSGYESAAAISVDSSGNAYLTGWTYSSDFPIKNPYLGRRYNADAFVTQISPNGDDLVYSTYLGSDIDKDELGLGVDVDSRGSAYVTGHWDHFSFVTQFSRDGRSLKYWTTLTGIGGWNYAAAIAVDAAGHAYVTGNILPWMNYDVFVSRIAPPPSCCVPEDKLRGDIAVTIDGTTDGSDLQAIVDYFFFNDRTSLFECLDAEDMDNDAYFDSSDLQTIIDYIFFSDTSTIKRCDGSGF